ncbi:MAG: hypothetical protein C0402_13495 [Thermodesulfovibrio sp.]|nr:hypothetical protein [Thermodesulfovibrio sp.]
MENGSALITPPAEGEGRAPLPDKVWCIHYECYKYVDVCSRCRIRIKCRNYLNYWSPPFSF